MSGFGRALHAEWTKLRTIRGWVLTMLGAAAVMVALGVLPSMQGSCGKHGPGSECVAPVGPDGLEVTDSFTFVHRPLTGDGSLTARVSTLTGQLPGLQEEQLREGLAPWAKAGLIIKDGTGQGSAYAAVMLTGAHGVRLQHNYLYDHHDDSAGPHTADGLRWLRLTRAGQRVTAQASPDGQTWTTVGTVVLQGLPQTVQIGMFVTSPQHVQPTSETLGLSGAMGGPTQATATFDQLDSLQGWTGQRIGGSPNGPEYARSRFAATETGFTVTGSGDIAPAVAGAAGAGVSVTQTLAGTFLALLLMVVIGVGFATGEYRTGMIRMTLAASPRRAKVLAAKATVLGAAAFTVGLAAAAIVVTVGQKVLRGNGVYVLPATTGTQLRIIAATAVLLALGAILALGLGMLLRRSATAVTVAVVTIVLPYLLAMTVLPATPAQWLLRISPAAAFAGQQSAVQYDQVANLYTPPNGYFPLPPWAGLAVLAVWCAATLTFAGYRLRRADA